jgi:hypothetical protein
LGLVLISPHARAYEQLRGVAGPGYKGLVCTLLLSKTGVKIGIARGSELPDPKPLMQGSGKVHRHVQLQTIADLKQPGLKPLLKAALSAWKKRNEVKG